jgi:hypothetical protein
MCDVWWAVRNVYRILFGKPKFVKHRCHWENNIKCYLKER